MMQSKRQNLGVQTTEGFFALTIVSSNAMSTSCCGKKKKCCKKYKRTGKHCGSCPGKKKKI
ncbi:hypothetical protein [Membranihabitans marinus]|uniref:hypothetical protein n=1 Tax=Membranihabitans marinus TaxID=1227546 RepID=UPI001F1DF47E|nr:hypothetical protein [Membranihabitans marinus]